MGAPFEFGGSFRHVSQFVAVRARKRTVFLVAALATLLPLVGLSAVPRADAADPTLSFVGATNAAGNRLNHKVTLPTGLQAGDTLVLFMTVNSLNGGTLATPAGWTLLQSKDGTATRGRAWTKQATAGDSRRRQRHGHHDRHRHQGRDERCRLPQHRRHLGGHRLGEHCQAQHGDHQLHRPRRSTSPRPVPGWSTPGARSPRTTPRRGPPRPAALRAPAPVGTGGGKVSSLLADSNAAVATGTATGRTATTNLAGGNSQLFSVVVSPGTGTAPTNQPPVPSFTTSCTAMTCSFNAGATTDPDNNPLTYSWNFGDGATGSGVTASRTYATTGTKTVTLTVGDGTTTAQTTRTVSPTAGTTAAVLSYVGSASSSSAGSTRTSHTVQLPANVQAGDTLVLFLVVNSLSGTLGNPSGWTSLQTKNGSVTRGRAWTKRATAADAGANVTVTSSAALKDTMTVSAYRSTGGNSSVTASALTAGIDHHGHQPQLTHGCGRAGQLLAGQLLVREVVHGPDLDPAREQPQPPRPGIDQHEQDQLADD